MPDIRPLLEASGLPFDLPDFVAVATAGDDAVLSAFREAFALHRAEVAAIVDTPEPADFTNTVVALERAGRELDRVASVFFNLAGTDATEARQAVEAQVAPEYAAHWDAVRLDGALWRRLQQVDPPEADPEGALLLEKLRRDFRRHGAALDAEGKRELADLNRRLSELGTTFGENLLAETQAGAVLVADESRLAGLDAATRAQLAAAARDRGHETGWLLTLDLPTVQQWLTRLAEPELRREVWEASVGRGSGVVRAGDAGREAGAGRDNRPLVLEIARLRARRARLLGHRTHADWVLADQVAGSAEAAAGLMADLAPAAAANAQGEWKRAADLAAEGGHVGELAAWDWPYWAERLRAEEYAVDDEAVRPYLELDRVLRDGVFYAAELLYGLTVVERPELRGYADGVQVWEVRDQAGPGDRAGAVIGLLLTDYYARPVKRGGAWMSSFVEQSRLLGTRAVVVNVLGVTPPAAGEPTLLTPDEVRTAFHEFGHALHGLLSEVTYPTFSGTNVPRDFVEFPSQLNENWAWHPAVLGRFARHHRTGEVIPASLVAALRRAERAGQGFATAEQLAASLLDLAWHSLTVEEAEAVTDVEAFEAEALVRAGIDVPHLAPRYRSAYFNHIFAGGYSAGYYSYLWAEAMDADAGAWWAGNAGESEVAGESEPDVETDVAVLRERGDRYRHLILSRGATIDYSAAFRELTGHDVGLDGLLERRGLTGTVS